MGQDRWVSYIFRYRNGVKCESAGFIKVQKNPRGFGEMARIQIGLKLYKKRPCKCMAYLIYGENQCRYLTDIYIEAEERDTTIKKMEIPWGNPLGDGMSMSKYDGIFFVCDDGEILVGMWQEYAVSVDNMRFEKEVSNKVNEIEKGHDINQNISYSVKHVETENPENNPENCQSEAVADSETTSAKEESAKTQGAESELSRNNQARKTSSDMETAFTQAEKKDYMQVCREMLSTYPRLPLFPDSQFMECVKIIPHDIGKLAMGNWKLGVNSFLSHGYYHYRYLMLGKVKFDYEEKYVIGVPGVYTNKEKYLANMFGFNVFIPVKRAKILTGNFGYWISEVSNV